MDAELGRGAAGGSRIGSECLGVQGPRFATAGHVGPVAAASNIVAVTVGIHADSNFSRAGKVAL